MSVIPQVVNPDAIVMPGGCMLRKEFYAERDEILTHKWIESEKAGYDIGFEKALLDWITKHRKGWKEKWERENGVVS